MKTIEDIDTLIKENLANANFGVSEQCAALNISQPQLYRYVKAHAGISTVQYIRNYRLEQSKILLKTKEFSVTLLI